MDKDMNVETQHLIQQLVDKKGFEREHARKELVMMGESAVPSLMELTENHRHTLRWESMKALSDMGLQSLIGFFIEKLESEESDIRWIASEGLITIGSSVIKPILLAVIENSDSVFLRSGAHHVIHALLYRTKLHKAPHLKKLLHMLKKTSSNEKLLIATHEFLDELK